MVKYFAPASIGNVGVGFDLLGAAIEPIDGSLLGDVVSVEESKDGINFNIIGKWKNKLPADFKDNIVYKCAKHYIENFGSKIKSGLSITLEKNMPIGSGLGSSASSIVAAVCAFNNFFANPLNNKQMIELMGVLEGSVSGSVHYDNVAPSFLGGIQMMLESPEKICDSIPHFKNWFWIVAYPGISLSTAKMRSLLPDSYKRDVMIDYGRNLGGFIHASYSNDEALAIAMLKDVVAEPFRSSSIPGYENARKALSELGCLTTGISGSGPTLFSISDNIETAKIAEKWLTEKFLDNEAGFVKICKISQKGAKKLVLCQA